MNQQGSTDQSNAQPDASAWDQVDARIHEAVNSSVNPLQDQIGMQRQVLDTITEQMRILLGHRDAAAPAQHLATEARASPNLAPPNEVPPTAFRNRKPLPKPPQFTGKKNDYPVWRQQMIDKLALDSQFFSSDAERWYFIFSCLEPGPQATIATFYREGATKYNHSPQAMFDYLDQNYKDPFVKKKAMSQLRSLRLSENQTFATFLPKFERLMADAGAIHWPDDAKISLAENALNKRIRSALVAVNLPDDDYPRWLSRVQEVASKEDQFHSDFAAPSQRHLYTTPHRNKNRETTNLDKEGDTRMGGVNRLAQQSSERARKETRTCYRCDKPGHLAAHCRSRKGSKNRAINRSSEGRNATTSQRASDEEEEEESGKE